MPEPTSPQDLLMRFILGKWIAKPIYVVAELGVADLLKSGPMTVENIAKQTGTKAEYLYRILRALASVGIFIETEAHCFSLTPMAEWLQSDKLRPMARMFNAPWNDQAWMSLLDSIKTGETAFDLSFGTDFITWLGQNHGDAAILAEANARRAEATQRAIVDKIDCSNIDVLFDVGGGTATLLCNILKANPNLKGLLIDLPPALAEAKKTIEQYDLLERCQIKEGNFFESLPEVGADAILLSNILHDWPDEACRQILSNCHASLKTGGSLHIIEMIIKPGNNPSVAKLLDLEMMVLSNGKERSEEEFKVLLRQGGFEISNILSIDTELFLIEAMKI